MNLVFYFKTSFSLVFQSVNLKHLFDLLAPVGHLDFMSPCPSLPWRFVLLDCVLNFGLRCYVIYLVFIAEHMVLFSILSVICCLILFYCSSVLLPVNSAAVVAHSLSLTSWEVKNQLPNVIPLSLHPGDGLYLQKCVQITLWKPSLWHSADILVEIQQLLVAECSPITKDTQQHRFLFIYILSHS